MRTETRLALVTLVVVGMAASCGGRAGIEIFGYDGLTADGGLGDAAGAGGGVMEGGLGGAAGIGGTGGSVLPDASDDVSADVSQDVSVDTGPQDAPNDQKDFFETLPPLPDSGPIGECMSCLQGECGTEINACYNDPVCIAGTQCVVTDCLLGGGGGGAGGSGGAGGQIDFMCVLGCFNNDLGSAMAAISMFSCITQTCGDNCGLGGLAGGGGAGGGAAMFAFGNDNLFGAPSQQGLSRRQHYINSVRVPAPEEVACCYPWLVDVLSGRRPNPLPPSMAAEQK